MKKIHVSLKFIQEKKNRQRHTQNEVEQWKESREKQKQKCIGVLK